MNEDFICTNQYTGTWPYTRMVHAKGMSDFPPAIIGCAITGSNHGKEANPNLPETVDEQVRSAYEAYKAGASMIHIHRRDPNDLSKADGLPKELFQEINIKIREKCPDVIINDTCAVGAEVKKDGTRDKLYFESLYAEPEIISIDTSCYTSYIKLPARDGVREAQVHEYMYTITQTEVELATKLCREHGVRPEFECFQLSDLYYLERLMQEGYLKEPIGGGPHLLNFVFTAASNWPTPDFVSTLVRACPDNTQMMISATGAQQWSVLSQALVWGTNVRVGMEDNIYIERGKLADSNGQLVEKIVRMSNDIGRKVASCEEARRILHMGAPRTW